MTDDIALLIQIQTIDSRIAELEREIAMLPRYIAQIEKTLESHQRKLEADQAALAANQKERKKLEADIQVQEQKQSKLKGQMMDAKTNDQYRAFQHEIDFCLQAVRKCEDRILVLMEEAEPLEANLKAAGVALDQEKHQVEREKKIARARTATDQQQLAEAHALRAKDVTAVNPHSYTIYERVRKKKSSAAVADGTDGRCASCHITLRPQFFQDLKSSETVMLCETCGSILYYNPAVVVEPEAVAPEPGLPVA